MPGASAPSGASIDRIMYYQQQAQAQAQQQQQLQQQMQMMHHRHQLSHPQAGSPSSVPEGMISTDYGTSATRVCRYLLTNSVSIAAFDAIIALT